jgi:hypothetical protein
MKLITKEQRVTAFSLNKTERRQLFGAIATELGKLKFTEYNDELPNLLLSLRVTQDGSSEISYDVMLNQIKPLVISKHAILRDGFFTNMADALIRYAGADKSVEFDYETTTTEAE